MSSQNVNAPLFFREFPSKEPKGLRILPETVNYTADVSQPVQAICFPYIISEAVMSDAAVKARVKKFQKLTNVSMVEKNEMLYEEIPPMISAKYRRYLQQHYPSIASLPLILIFTMDREGPYSVADDVFCIRTSLRRSDKRAQDLCFPSPIEWAEYQGPLSSTETSIGFCGVPHNHKSRASLLEFLYNSGRCKTDFIFRKQFWGHLRKKASAEQAFALEEEFRSVIYRNIFSVSSRGAGNYSTRFYETMRAGRIPVLLDSDTVLPFEEDIDWKNLIIWEKTPEEAERKIIDWTSNRDLVVLQNQCRKIWEEYLYLPSFMKKLPSLVGPLL